MTETQKALQRAKRALRDAALAWGNALPSDVKDKRDSAFKKLDNALLRAALKYAEAAHADAMEVR